MNTLFALSGSLPIQHGPTTLVGHFFEPEWNGCEQIKFRSLRKQTQEATMTNAMIVMTLLAVFFGLVVYFGLKKQDRSDKNK